MIVLWIPLAIALSFLFDPALSPNAQQIVAFAIAIWGAYLIRTMFQESLGMLCFWTTRGAAIFDLWMTLELLLSGRLVPLPLMPDWVQELSRFLPFQWAFYFPINSLVGDLSNAELVRRAARAAPLDPRRPRDLPCRLAVGHPTLQRGGRLR